MVNRSMLFGTDLAGVPYPTPTAHSPLQLPDKMLSCVIVRLSLPFFLSSSFSGDRLSGSYENTTVFIILTLSCKTKED
ncbi:hypothetical protein BaRGS_00024408 [Batillaria attramentaria]|uniref:Uncharacterized protein n=1 Tax=Batillaria attramentaria TaxID=370345 RepID=A0ABD0KBD4_9CAEN